MGDSIEAISSLWPLVLVIVSGLIVFCFKKEIKTLLIKRNVKIKKGDLEVEVTNEGDNTNKSIPIENQNENVNNKSFSDNEIIEEEKIVDALNHEDKILETSREKLMNSYHINRDSAMLTNLYNELQSQELNSDEKTKNEAFYLQLMFGLGDITALKKLESIGQINKESIIHDYILNRIGYCYKNISDFEKASQTFKQAADELKDPSQKAMNIILSADCIFEINKERAYQEIIELIKCETSRDANYIYYRGLGNLYEKADENEKMLLAFEKASEFSPNNTDILFAIAYGYKKDVFRDLSILHYKNLLNFEPENTGALNNIGVEYTNSQLLSFAKKSYKKAAANNNTLTNANLAYEYMNIGLYDEAYEILNKAKGIDDFHKNVASAFVTLKEKEEIEQKKESEIIKKALVKQRFIRKYADSYFIPYNSQNKFQGNWIFEDGLEVIISEKDSNITFSWTDKKEQTYKIDGTINNKAIKITLFELKKEWPTLEPEYKIKSDGYMYLLEDEQYLNILLFKKNSVDFEIKKLSKVI